MQRSFDHGPSLSHEINTLRPRSTVKLCMGPSMDTQITRALFNRVIETSELLNIDASFDRI